jgi:ribosomal protein L14E/L6E/L27E
MNNESDDDDEKNLVSMVDDEEDTFAAIIEKHRINLGHIKPTKTAHVKFTADEQKNKKNEKAREKYIGVKQIRPLEKKIHNEDRTENGIIGSTRRQLLHKITLYKSLFESELKSFKINKNADDSVLQQYLNEMSDIVSIQSIDKFIVSGILRALADVEPISKLTKFDLTGLAEKLRSDESFNVLIKKIYIKRAGFLSNLPDEINLLFVVIGQAAVVTAENNASKLSRRHVDMNK